MSPFSQNNLPKSELSKFRQYNAQILIKEIFKIYGPIMLNKITNSFKYSSIGICV